MNGARRGKRLHERFLVHGIRHPVAVRRESPDGVPIASTIATGALVTRRRCASNDTAYNNIITQYTR